MKTPGGVQGVPYSNIEQARQMPGYDFANFNEYARYTKDRSADPHAPAAPDGYAPPEIEQAKGALKSAVQVPNTLAGWLDAIVDKAAGHPAQPLTTFKSGLEKAENAVAPGVTNPTHGFDQAAGGFAETLGEWLYGEGEARTAYEALSQSEKLAKVAQAAKFIEQHPPLAAALRTAAVGGGSGAQAMLHGATPTEAAEAAAVGGGIAGAGEAIGAGIGAVRSAIAAREGVQAAAQGQIRDVAQKATQDALERLNATREPATVQTQIVPPHAAIPAREGADSIDQGINAARAKAQLGSMANTIPDRLMPQNPIVQELGPRAALVPDRIWGEIPATEGMHVESEVPPNFARIENPADEASSVRSFGDAAEKIREHALPVYEQLNAATGGKFNELRMARTAAYKSGNVAARREADLGIEKLLADKPKGVSAEDYATAKSAWKDTKTLDRIHDAVERSFNGISEDLAADPQTSERLLRTNSAGGATLQDSLGNLLRGRDMPARVEGVIGKEGLLNLYRAANLISNSATKTATMKLAEGVSNLLGAGVGGGIGAGIGHAIAGPTGGEIGFGAGAYAGKMLTSGARDVMRKMAMSPRVGQLMDFAVRNNVSLKIAAAAVAAEIRREQGSGPENGGTQ